MTIHDVVVRLLAMNHPLKVSTWAPQPTPGPPPVEFLKNFPTGAYTTAVSVGGARPEFWERHIKRVAQSSILVCNSGPDVLPTLRARLGAGSEDGGREAAPDPGAAADFEDYLSEAANRLFNLLLGTAKDMNVSSGTLMVVVAVTEPPHETSLAHAGSPAAGGAWPGVAVYLSSVERPAAKPVRIAIVRADRRLPEAKHTSWVGERAWIESLVRPLGVAEAVMMREGGGVTEGLVTNFYAIRDGPAGGPPELVTAPVSGNVLPGVVRMAVLESCDTVGLRHVPELPSVADIDNWREAFLTNAVRLVQPVGEVLVVDAGGAVVRTIQLPGGPYTAALADEVDRRARPS